MIGRVYSVLPSIVIVVFLCGVASESYQISCGNLSIISINVFPDFVSYTVGSTVTISCNATIGRNGTGQEWIWEYKDGNGWSRYTEENNTRKDDPILVDGSCQYYLQTYYLTRVISMEDNGRYYRCTVNRDSESAKSETIRIQKVEDQTTSASVTTMKAGKQISSAGGPANNLLTYLITSVSVVVMMPSGF